MTTDGLPKISPQDTGVSDDPLLDGRTYSTEVGKRPMACALEEGKELQRLKNQISPVPKHNHMKE
jgi:hypothetical protein